MEDVSVATRGGTRSSSDPTVVLRALCWDLFRMSLTVQRRYNNCSCSARSPAADVVTFLAIGYLIRMRRQNQPCLPAKSTELIARSLARSPLVGCAAESYGSSTILLASVPLSRPV